MMRFSFSATGHRSVMFMMRQSSLALFPTKAAERSIRSTSRSLRRTARTLADLDLSSVTVLANSDFENPVLLREGSEEPVPDATDAEGARISR